MLHSLRLTNVGPAPAMALQFAERINLITGDNGLGKSFLLDVAWWGLTQTWGRQLVRPNQSNKQSGTKATIASSFGASGTPSEVISQYVPGDDRWLPDRFKHTVEELVLYAHVDGGFSCWDPSNPPLNARIGLLPPLSFTPSEVWDGNSRCEGLIRDWASWQLEKNDEFTALVAVLAALSPSANEPLKPGALMRLSAEDPKRYPTLATEYGQDVPVVHAAAGIRRVISLAYMLIWLWRENALINKLKFESTTPSIILLIDEVEAHLHPKWQLRIVPALLSVMRVLTKKTDTHLQIIASTHSPLVLASVEPEFDSAKDAWFDLDLVQSKQGPSVVLQQRPFEKLGTANRWLMSEAFGLFDEGRNDVARALLKRAAAALEDPKCTRAKGLALDRELHSVLGETDPYWNRWRFFADKRGWTDHRTSSKLRPTKPTLTPKQKPTATKSTKRSAAKRKAGR